MGKIKIIELSDTESRKLNLGFVEGASHCYRMRCKVIVLKSEGLTSKEIGNRVGMHPLSVDHWIHRYEQESIPDLKTRSGRGSKPIMDIQDEAAVRKAIEIEHLWNDYTKKPLPRIHNQGIHQCRQSL